MMTTLSHFWHALPRPVRDAVTILAGAVVLLSMAWALLFVTGG